MTVAAPLTLSELGVDAAILTGEVELRQRRYLHLEPGKNIFSDTELARD